MKIRFGVQYSVKLIFKRAECRASIFQLENLQLHTKTRMHSSRMRTSRFSGCLGRGVVVDTPRQTPLWTDTPRSDIHPWVDTPLGRHPPDKHPLWADNPLPNCMLGYTPPPYPIACLNTQSPRTEGMTDACENITFAQLLLWTVIIFTWGEYLLVVLCRSEVSPTARYGIHS